MQGVCLTTLFPEDSGVHLLGCDFVGVQREDRKFAVPIKESDIFHHIPVDINKFISSVYPNLLKLSESRARIYGLNPLEVLNEFVVSMLEKGRDGVIRYQRYDPELAGNISYVIWFVSQMKWYFLQGATRRVRRAAIEVSIEGLREGFGGVLEDDSAAASSFDLWLDRQNHHNADTTFQEVAYSEVLAAVKRYSEGYGSLGKVCFEQWAFFMLEKRLEGVSNTELSALIGVSLPSIANWLVKLQRLVLDLIEGRSIKFA